MSKMFISRESLITRKADDKQSFYAVEIDLPEETADALRKFNEDTRAIQKYLIALESTNQGRTGSDLSKVEVPACLIEAPSAEPPKKKATAPRSKKKSPTKPRKTKASSSTSQQKDA